MAPTDLFCFQALFFSYLEGIQDSPEENYNEGRASIKKCTKGLIFASTPHRGADPAHWPAMATRLAKFIQKDCSDKLVNALQRGSDVAEILQSNFAKIIKSFGIYTLFEELPYPGIGTIVEKDSAVFAWQYETVIKIHANHSDMVKFSDSRDNNYKTGFKKVIAEMIRDRIEKRASAEIGTRPN